MRPIIWGFVFFILFTSLAFAGKMIPKSGEIIAGELVEQTGDRTDEEKTNPILEEYQKEIENPTTAWGRWLQIIQIYWDQCRALSKKYHMELDISGLSSHDMTKKANPDYLDYYNAMADIIPPPELKKYHEKILKLLKITVLSNPDNIPNREAEIDDIINDLKKEFIRVFREHGVPKEIAEEVAKQFHGQ